MSDLLPTVVESSAVSLRRDAAALHHGRCLIKAATDEEAIAFYLAQKAGTPRTFEAYEREVGRFWLWCRDQGLTELDQVSGEDIFRYQQAMAEGQVLTAKERKALAGAVARLESPGDDAVRRKPQASSVNYALGILKAMYEYLFKVRYLTGNAFVAVAALPEIKGRGKVQRYLTKADWGELMATVEALPREADRHEAIYHQTRWLVCLAVLAGLRRTEAAEGWMANVHRSEDGRWWLAVTGKGRKERAVPAPARLLDELMTYRAWLRAASGLEDIPPLPGGPDDQHGIPLVCRVDGTLQPLGTRRIGKIVENIVSKTADRIRAAGDETRAALFERISTHWLRHTAVTAVANNTDVRTAKEYAGHSDIRTTMLYVHDEDQALHDKVNEAYARSGLFSTAAASSTPSAG